MPFGFRADGDRVTDAPLTRRIMPHLMPTRNQALVFFDMEIAASPVNSQLQKLREKGLHATITHLISAAAASILVERPRLNRFVAGGRIWQRRGIWVSFSAKKEKSDKGAVFVLKRELKPNATVEEVVATLNQGFGEGRSDKKSATDKELSLAFLLPNFVVGFVVRALMMLDHWGLLPRSIIDKDEMFASLFIANLGSLGMDAGRHHLYEYGNIPIFCMIGRERDAFYVDDGVVKARRVYPLHFTFDERIEDGLYCLKALELLKQKLEGGQW